MEAAGRLRAARRLRPSCPSEEGHELARFDAPSVAAAQQLCEVSRTTLGSNIGDLLVDYVFVARQISPRAQNADRSWKAFAVFHVRQLERIERARMMRVVDHKVSFADT